MKYDVLFIGATVGTCAAVEILTAQGKKCMITEKYIWVGHEYAVAHRSDRKAYIYNPISPEAKMFKAELIERNVIAEGKGEHLPAVFPILAERLKQSGVDCLFHTRIIGISEECDGFKVKAFTSGQTVEFTAEKIIDTTSEFQSRSFFHACTPKYTGKSINSLVLPPDDYTLPSLENVEMVEGRFDGELFMKLKVPCGQELGSTQKFVYDYWINRPPILKEYRIIYTPPIIDYSPAERRLDAAEKAVYLPSGYYWNFMEAYDNFAAFTKE